MEQSDKLLRKLIERVNQSGTFLDVTVMVNGGLITGKIAPTANWLTGNAEQLAEMEEFSEFAQDFEEERRSYDLASSYLHLSSARVVYGDLFVPRKGASFRVPLSEVSGWMLGRLELKD